MDFMNSTTLFLGRGWGRGFFLDSSSAYLSFERRRASFLGFTPCGDAHKD